MAGLIWQQSQMNGFYPAWWKAQRWTCTKTPEEDTHTHSEKSSSKRVNTTVLFGLMGQKKDVKKGNVERAGDYGSAAKKKCFYPEIIAAE